VKVTRLGPTRATMSLAGVLGSSGSANDIPSGQVPTANGSNGVSWGSNVATIWANGSNQLIGPAISLASGSNILFTLDQGPGGSMPSNTLRIHSTSSGGGVTAHGALTGLAADDHSAYVTVTGGGGETVQAHGSAGATETINLANGNSHAVTLDADCTFTFSGATNGVECSFTLELTEDGTGGWEPTWPGSVVWPGGDTPAHDTTAGSVSIYVFRSRDGGTTWYGFATGSGGSSDPADDTFAWMPLTTVVSGAPELVWDADDSLIPTLVPLV
jgi:hypothetical protein